MDWNTDWDSFLREIDDYDKDELEDCMAVYGRVTNEVSRRLSLHNLVEETEESHEPETKNLDRTVLEPIEECSEREEKAYKISKDALKKIRACFRAERSLRKKAEEERRAIEKKLIEEQREQEMKMDQIAFENDVLRKKNAALSEAEGVNLTEIANLEKQLYHAKMWTDELFEENKGLRDRLKKEEQKRAKEMDI